MYQQISLDNARENVKCFFYEVSYFYLLTKGKQM